jgi:hypothetical protein
MLISRTGRCVWSSPTPPYPPSNDIRNRRPSFTGAGIFLTAPVRIMEIVTMARIRIDTLSTWRTSDFARRSGRTFTDAIGILISAGYRSLTESSSSSPTLVGDLTNEEAIRPGKSVSAHMKSTTIAGIKEFAALEERSFSSATETLVRIGLHERGLLRAHRLPCAANRAELATSSGAETLPALAPPNV